MTDHRPRPGLRPTIVVVALLAVAACSSGGPPATSAPSSPDAGSQPPDSVVTSPPDSGGDVQLPGGAKPIVPKPGQLDVHPVAADSLAARVDGSTVIVTATWTSGVEPCSVLDSILVQKGDGTMTITLREGRGPEEVACIAIAELHSTVFEVRDVAAGTWTIVDSGGRATPVQVTVG
jgi:hypothetical protein